MNSIPYTYVITFLITGQRYYGVRYSKFADPVELGKTYFSSSKLIKSLIKEYGLSYFNFEIRKIFDDRNKACLWESKVLKRLDAAHSNVWLNRRNNEGNFYARGKHSSESKIKMSLSKKGKYLGRKGLSRFGYDNPMYGKNHSEETKRKMSEIAKKRPYKKASADSVLKRIKANTGKLRSEETKRKMSEARKNYWLRKKLEELSL